MTDEIKDLTNVDNDLIATEAEKIVRNVAIYKGSTRKQQFYMYHMFNLPINLCAKLCGYKPGYGYQLNRELKNDPKVRQSVEQILSDMPKAYRSICKARLLQIANIEGKGLNEYENNPKLTIDKPQLLKQIKQGAGVNLNEEEPAPKQPTVNIGEIRLFWQQVFGDEPIDAEVVEDTYNK